MDLIFPFVVNLSKENILRFNIAMNKAAFMHGLESVDLFTGLKRVVGTIWMPMLQTERSESYLYFLRRVSKLVPNNC